MKLRLRDERFLVVDASAIYQAIASVLMNDKSSKISGGFRGIGRVGLVDVFHSYRTGAFCHCRMGKKVSMMTD